MEGETTTIITILETSPNTNKNDQIDLVMLYQSDIIDYINRSQGVQEKTSQFTYIHI